VKNGRLALVDQDEILRNANRISREMVERAEKRTGIEFLKKPALIAGASH
jgi:hypothetical protein